MSVLIQNYSETMVLFRSLWSGLVSFWLQLLFSGHHSIFQVEYILFDTKHVKIDPKFVPNHGFGYIFGFGSAWFCLVLFWFGSNHCFNITIQFSSLSTCFLIPKCHCKHQICPKVNKLRTGIYPVMLMLGL